MLVRWNYESVAEAASKCKTKKEFQDRYSGAVKYARRHNIYDEVTKHFTVRFAWTHELIFDFVKTCRNITEFTDNTGAREYAKKHNLIDGIREQLRVRTVWNHELVAEVALNYTKRTLFIEEQPGAHNYAVNNNIYDEITKHMDKRNFYDYDTVKKLASKCETRWEFQQRFKHAYRYAFRNKLLDDIGKHFKVVGNKAKRKIYQIRFNELKKCYVGLTCNPKTRKESHLKCSSNRYVRQLIENGEKFEWIEDDIYYPEELIGVLEKYRIKYMEDNGWHMLNINRGGGLGNFKKKKKK